MYMINTFYFQNISCLNIERNECAQTISLLQLRSCLSIVDIERMRGDKYRDEIISTTSARP